MPSWSTDVARRVPTMHGTPSSRLTIAAWQVMPPLSVTSAPARRMTGTQSGLVIGATRISPGSSAPPFGRFPEDAHPAGDDTGRRAQPAHERTSRRPRLEPPPAAVTRSSVVIGRDCTRKISPPSIAHSVSCGAP